MGAEKGFTKVRMEVIVCNNCGEIDRVNGNSSITGKCWHCGNKGAMK